MDNEILNWIDCTHQKKQDRITSKDPRPTAFSVPKRNKNLVV